MLLPAIAPLDTTAAAAARELQDRLTKPRGALGRLEDLSVQLCAIAGTCPAPVPGAAAIAVFAADHGVVADGVTPWPQEVTVQMVANFANGGAAISVLARQHQARLIVVDVGVATPVIDAPNVWNRNVRRGTASLVSGPAMTHDEAEQCVNVGIDTARALIADGADLLITGEMGIGNTTAAAAIIAALSGRTAADCTGRGTGIDDTMLLRKTAIIERAIASLSESSDPLAVLERVGGLEIGALAGFIIGAASERRPVVVDGVIALAGLLLAERLAPGTARYAIAGHRSPEPGAKVALEVLGLEALVDLGMRLGEGSGAAVALPIVRSAALLLAEMATFDSAGVSDKDPATPPDGQ
jgi:nicotinate-nucleotide--dimethylbenzimidazole phosphoribosyltransferase